MCNKNSIYVFIHFISFLLLSVTFSQGSICMRRHFYTSGLVTYARRHFERIHPDPSHDSNPITDPKPNSDPNLVRI